MDLQERLKVIEEDVNHKKNHIESIRRQLQACTKEKAKYEMMYNKAREEIEKRVRDSASLFGLTTLTSFSCDTTVAIERISSMLVKIAALLILLLA